CPGTDHLLLSVGHTEIVTTRGWIVTMLAVVFIVAGSAVAALLAWPAGAVADSGNGLAGVSLPGFAGAVEHVSVKDPAGKPVPVVLRHGTLWPREQLAPGERLTVTVDIDRPGWIGWLVGGHVERTVTVVTPVAHIHS